MKYDAIFLILQLCLLRLSLMVGTFTTICRHNEINIEKKTKQNNIVY